MALLLACEQMTTPERVTNFCSCSVDVLADADWEMDDIIDAASDLVVIATGGAVKGRCSTTVRPCADTSCMCGRLADGCDCCRLDAIRLPGDAIAITEVKIDGETLAASNYGWFDGDGLIRIGADQPRTWPGCQKLYLDDTEEGTFSIEYEFGVLPLVAVMSATEIACDLLLGVTGKTSRLDPRVVTAVMDGVTMDFDPQVLGLFDWTKRLVGRYSSGPRPIVWSPEVDEGWTLHTMRPA
jgi:hypothetical protein